MLTIKYQAAFKKDYKRIVKRGYDIRLLEKVIEPAGQPETVAGEEPGSSTRWELCRLPGMSHHAGLAVDL